MKQNPLAIPVCSFQLNSPQTDYATKHQSNSAVDKCKFKPNYILSNKARPLHQVYIYISFFSS